MNGGVLVLTNSAFNKYSLQYFSVFFFNALMLTLFIVECKVPSDNQSGTLVDDVLVGSDRAYIKSGDIVEMFCADKVNTNCQVQVGQPHPSSHWRETVRMLLVRKAV